ncbi:RNA-directed DNA polymerase, eukaryota [Artemisia annua]|uniref:RNA-directed DNA polymerase, eukaryota n=1 Tax=Artemisia annua TaxID=35608 RepID=A0A2U1L240_ARTAN|nr:RNA-directed DNA polymerase, eukaryota [Artemisia annua]
MDTKLGACVGPEGDMNTFWLDNNMAVQLDHYVEVDNNQVHVQIREENNHQGFIIAENGKDECIRNRGDLSPNANSSGGDRIRKKRKADDEGGFVSESIVSPVIYAAGYIGSCSGNKKTGRKSIKKAIRVARKTGVLGLGEDKKGISDAYKEYSVEEHNMNEKALAVGEERTNLDTQSCSISLEQVKEIGELIGVSWIGPRNRGKMGFGDNDKKGWVKSIINEERPDVIGIQETKCGMVDECWIEGFWGGKGFGFTQLEANGNSGGIMVIWDNNSFTCKEAMGDERFLAVKGEWKGLDGDVFLVCIYGPHISRQKASLWDRLSWLMERMGGALYIFGDFNVVRYCEDRLPCQVNVREMSDFNEFINNARLVELYPNSDISRSRTCDV